MRTEERSKWLKIGAAVVVGVFLLDRVVLSPALAHWSAQSQRIASLKEKVERGRQLIERSNSIRGRWAEMERTDLPEDSSTAENEVFKALGRWARDSRITFNSLTPQWRNRDEGYDTFECQVAATGDLPSLARLLYEIEVDPLPARVEQCELTTKDPHGRQLTVIAKISVVRLTAAREARR